MCRRFGGKNVRTGRDETFDGGEIGANLADDDTHIGENIAHQAIRAAVGLRRGDDLVAGPERGEQSRGNGGHAGRSDYGGFRAFEGSDFLFGHGECGIAVTRVNVGLVFALGPQLHFFRGRKRKSRRADNFGNNGAVNAAAVRFSAVNGLRLRPELVLGFAFHWGEWSPLAPAKTSSKLAPAQTIWADGKLNEQSLRLGLRLLPSPGPDPSLGGRGKSLAGANAPQ